MNYWFSVINVLDVIFQHSLLIYKSWGFGSAVGYILDAEKINKKKESLWSYTPE